jgi:hypothetical protein
MPVYFCRDHVLALTVCCRDRDARGDLARTIMLYDATLPFAFGNARRSARLEGV